ncbi:hypothetical protein [Haliea salexigens]|uniref:hypothetical protein n=1 Tax=Haliea salexigens TaxID=287487 RepID=UPI001182B9C9|nr:hypothetical protein [Haliea salexigens]
MKLSHWLPDSRLMGIQQFFRRPMRFFIFILIARIRIDKLGLSMTARILLDSSGIDYIAFILGQAGRLRHVDYSGRRSRAAEEPRAGSGRYRQPPSKAVCARTKAALGRPVVPDVKM